MIQDWKLHYNGLLYQILFGTIVYIIGVIVTVLIVVVSVREGEEPVTWATVGSMFALFVMAFFGLMGGMSSYSGEFRMHLCLGGTRRGFLVSCFSRQAAGMAICYALVWIFYAGEQALYGTLFPGATCEVSVLPVLKAWYCLPLLGFVALVGMFTGVLRARFGSVGMAFFWVIWMFCCLVLPRMAHTGSDAPLDRLAAAMLGVFLAVPGSVWAAVLAALSAGMAAGVCYWGMKQDVR